MTGRGTARRRLLSVLLVGYLGLAGAVVAARSTPPTGWELNIYAATPLAFWAGVVVAVVAAVIVALHADRGTPPFGLAILLGPLAVVCVVALPILRSYYFFGPGDAMSYLGWTKLIADGRLDPSAFLYPGIHSVAIALSRTTGLSLRRALMTVPPLFVAVFVTFTALAADRAASGRRGLAAGAFLALLLLPVNNVHTFLIPYPTSAAIFLTPFVLYLLFRYVGDRGRLLAVGGRSLGTPAGTLLGLAGVAVVLYHPQVGANVVLLLAAVLGVQLVARVRGWFAETAVTSHRTLALQTGLVGGFFLVWTPRFDRAQGALSAVIGGVFGDATPGGEIAQRGGSLSELGTGLIELFLKLFAVSAVLSAVAGLVMLAVLVGRLDDRPDRNALLAYLTAGFAPVFALFGLFYLANATVQPFRYLGFMMAIVTVVVAVAVADGLVARPFRRYASGPWLKTAGIVVFALVLAPQMAMVFQSPYIYQPSSHVAEQQMDGYATAFEHRDPSVPFVGVRSGPRRYADAHYGTTYGDRLPDGSVMPGKRERVPPPAFGGGITDFLDRCRYVPVTRSDYDREVTLFEGLRYDADGFRELPSTPTVHRVQSNGHVRLYVAAADGSCTA